MVPDKIWSIKKTLSFRIKRQAKNVFPEDIQRKDSNGEYGVLN